MSIDINKVKALTISEFLGKEFLYRVVKICGDGKINEKMLYRVAVALHNDELGELTIAEFIERFGTKNLRRIPNFGVKSVNALDEYLRIFGLSLGIGLLPGRTELSDKAKTVLNELRSTINKT